MHVKTASEGVLCLSGVHRCRPVPILTLDEFILLHEVVQAAAQANPGAVSLLRNVQSTIGRNLLGNLIELGQVAFAPANPDVLQFADYMVQKHSEPPSSGSSKSACCLCQHHHQNEGSYRT